MVNFSSTLLLLRGRQKSFQTPASSPLATESCLPVPAVFHHGHQSVSQSHNILDRGAFSMSCQLCYVVNSMGQGPHLYPQCLAACWDQVSIRHVIIELTMSVSLTTKHLGSHNLYALYSLGVMSCFLQNSHLTLFQSPSSFWSPSSPSSSFSFSLTSASFSFLFFSSSCSSTVCCVPLKAQAPSRMHCSHYCPERDDNQS